MINFPDPYHDDGLLWIRILGCFAIAIVVVIILVCSTLSCSHVGWGQTYTGTIERFVTSPRGEYMVVRTNCATIEHMWKRIAPKELQHLANTRYAFTDIERKQIWYCTETGLQEELRNIKSLHNLWDAHKQDMRDAFPLVGR